VVLGFFTICAGVVLLQLSKSAKDVPDAAVFSGDLDQVRTIAEQEQSEMEPKADAIRGAAAIVRRFSQVRNKNELDEARRLHEEKQQDLEPIGENEHIEWDGLRRRRTTFGTNSVRSRANTTPFPEFDAHTPVQHPPLGMSRFPSESDSDHDEERPHTGSSMSFFARAKSIVGPRSRNSTNQQHVQSPMHPVPLTEINIPAYKSNLDGSDNAYYGHDDQGVDPSYGLPAGKTEYQGAGERERHITIVEDHPPRLHSSGSLHPSAGPTPPPHSARRQFSFQNVFRKGQSQAQAAEEPQPQSRSPMIRKGLGNRRGSTPAVKGATEEERLGLVKGDTNSGRQPVLPSYDDEDDDDEGEGWLDDKTRMRSDSEGSRDLTSRSGRQDKEIEAGGSGMHRSRSEEEEFYEAQRRNWDAGKQKGMSPGTGRALPPPPPDEDDEPRGGGRGAARGAFI